MPGDTWGADEAQRRRQRQALKARLHKQRNQPAPRILPRVGMPMKTTPPPAPVPRAPATPVRGEAADRGTGFQSALVRGAYPLGGPGRNRVAEAMRLVKDKQTTPLNIQHHLRHVGYTIPFTGKWDATTQRAWKDYAGSLVRSTQYDVLRRPGVPQRSENVQPRFSPQGTQIAQGLQMNRVDYIKNAQASDISRGVKPRSSQQLAGEFNQANAHAIQQAGVSPTDFRTAQAQLSNAYHKFLQGWVPRAVSDIGAGFVNAPAGAVYAAEHPGTALPAMAKQLGHEFAHPVDTFHRHPGDFLTLAAVPFTVGASSVGRAGTLLGTLREGEGLGTAVTRAARNNTFQMNKTRLLVHPVTGEVQQALYSKSPLLRGGQKIADTLSGMQFKGSELHLTGRSPLTGEQMALRNPASLHTHIETVDPYAKRPGGRAVAASRDQLRAAARKRGLDQIPGFNKLSKSDLQQLIYHHNRLRQQGPLSSFVQGVRGTYATPRIAMERAQNERIMGPIARRRNMQSDLAQMDTDQLHATAAAIGMKGHGPMTPDELRSALTNARPHQGAFAIGGMDSKALHDEANRVGLQGHTRMSDDDIRRALGLLQRPVTKGNAMDTINRASQIAQLYSSPKYLMNVAGQVLLAGGQMGPLALKRLGYDLPKMAKHLSPEAKTLRDMAMQGGATKALDTGTPGLAIARGVDTVHSHIANMWSYIVDKPWRQAAFYHEAFRAGYKDPAAIEKLITDPNNINEFTRVARRANRSAIDYARLGTREKKYIRRLWYFYPWYKGSTMYAGHFLTEHPYQAAAAQQLGGYGGRENEKYFGKEFPSFFQGMIHTGDTKIRGIEGKVPLGRNPAAGTILGTPGQVLQMLAGRGQYGAEDFGQYASPALTGAAAGLAHYNVSRGQKYKGHPGILGGVGLALNSITQNIPYVRGGVPNPAAPFGLGPDWLYQGQTLKQATAPDPGQYLIPYRKKDLLPYSLEGPFAARPINPYGSRKAYRQAYTSAYPGAKAIIAKAHYFREDALRELNFHLQRHGRPPVKTIPPPVERAISLWQGRQLSQLEAGKELGHKLRSQDKLVADMKFLYRHFAAPAARAKFVNGKWVYPPKIQANLDRLTNTNFMGNPSKQAAWEKSISKEQDRVNAIFRRLSGTSSPIYQTPGSFTSALKGAGARISAP